MSVNNGMNSLEEKGYTVLDQIGEGAEGKIFKVQEKKTGVVWAGKLLTKGKLEQVENEIRMLAACHHNNIVVLHAAEVCAEGVWLIIEHCEGSLADALPEPYSETQVAEVMRQMLSALHYLHLQNIVHGDVKASNILVKNDIYKLADFGLAAFSPKPSHLSTTYDEKSFGRNVFAGRHEPTKSALETEDRIEQENARRGKKLKGDTNPLLKVGSPFWMAPELLRENMRTTKIDIWALGITAIELVEGRPPYSHQHPYRAMFSIQSNPPKGVEHPEKYSAAFNDFVSCCLTLDPNERKNAKELSEHSFLSPLSDALNESCCTIIEHEDLPNGLWESSLLNSNFDFYNCPSSNHRLQNCSENKENMSKINNSRYHQENENYIHFHKNSTKSKNTLIEQLFEEMQQKIREIRSEYIKKIRNIHEISANSKNNNKTIR